MGETLERDVLFRKLRARPENKVPVARTSEGLLRCILHSALSNCPMSCTLWPDNRPMQLSLCIRNPPGISSSLHMAVLLRACC